MIAELKNKTVLRAYQRRWANDRSRLTFAVKAAQIGYSTASAAWAVDACLSPKATDRTLVVFLSRSERQSLELAEKAKQWVDGYEGVLAEFFPNQPFGETSILQHEIRFPNKSRIIALAANPDTARGYTGHVVLDEFAFHKDAEAIFRAAYRQTTLGYKVKVLSTPNGQKSKFFEIAKSLGFDTGLRPRRQPVRVDSRWSETPVDARWSPGLTGGLPPGFPLSRERPGGGHDPPRRAPAPRLNRGEAGAQNPWSGHWCDIHLAVEEGAPIDVDSVRAGCDEDTWLQEYCCQFISQASDWIPPELFQQCVSSEATASLGARGLGLGASPQSLIPGPELYAGWDVARKRDLSVIWISELVGDVTWTRAVVELRNMPTPDQVREALAFLPLLRRINMDKSGMGLAIFETLERQFPGRVEGVQFTQPSKEAMAVLAKRRMEEMKVRIPDTDAIRHSFRSVKKTVNAIGQARFDAEHDSKYGHADHWWAFCLAETAAEQPMYHLGEVGGLVGKPIAAGMMDKIL